MEKIVFLGNAGDSHTVGKQILPSGGFVVQTQGYQFHVDPGPGSLIHLADYKLNPRETTTLFITSPSLIHANDMNAVISAMTLNGVDQRGVLVAQSDIINGTEEEHPLLLNQSKNAVERVIEAKPGQKIGIGHIEVDTLKTTNPKTLGLKFKTPTQVITYAGDTEFDKDVVAQYEDSNILILNVPFPQNEKGEGLSADDAVKIIRQVSPDKTIITHFGKKMLQANPLYVARDMHRETGAEIIIAKRGLTIEF